MICDLCERDVIKTRYMLVNGKVLSYCYKCVVSALDPNLMIAEDLSQWDKSPDTWDIIKITERITNGK